MSKPAAFFDLDRTLIDVNSALLWAHHERAQGNVSSWQLAQATFWTAMYHLSLIDMERAFNEAVAYYKGEPFETLQERTRDWFHDEIRARLRTGAAEAMDAHRNEGHPLVILTNSSCFEAEVAAESWGFDHWLANHFPVDAQGCLLGTFATPMCYGAGKVHHARNWAEEHGVDLERSYFYTDSYSDLPMLEEVGQPRIVSPDPRLRRVARQRGWPILNW
ncbi:HAD-IB family hydrolase [Persicimonas caeni]|uniref:HAD-IB family hydrolase n=1 Tax=Persicimonas caeni TaxID=2292766 RepID=A0A4Y6PVE4_PERCE|nr:HAD-IB family hydrolase [Persicimonas caeni]QDG52324.1 HAD-IB family hydrolase [Persicimonas caeni]QED33546.1 HAD-IB family hydrolase [Persicimonas caeni]